MWAFRLEEPDLLQQTTELLMFQMILVLVCWLKMVLPLQMKTIFSFREVMLLV